MTEQEADEPGEHDDEHSADSAEADADAGTADEESVDAEAEGEAARSAAGESDPDAAHEAGIDIDADLDVADEVVEYVETTDTEELAREISSLRLEVSNLEADIEERDERIEELESKLKRKQADFENYKKRMQRRQEEEKQRATEDLVERLLDVRDNLTRALEQDGNADIRDGIETTLKQFDRVMDEENVTAIEPEPGDEVDPQRHEVLVRMDSDQPAGTIAQVHRPGYEMAGKVVRAAQVAVSEE
jgi:molecular chaperone GrpE